MGGRSETRTCMFCGGAPVTKTHLIAQRSIRQYLPPSTLTVGHDQAWVDEQGESQTAHRDFDLDPLLTYVKRACEPCNRDWMGALEIAVAGDVIALATGKTVTLEEGRADRLAVWATTVAMLRATQDSGPAVLDMADARALRETSRVPEGYVVALIHGTPNWGFVSRHQRFRIATSSGVRGTHATWFWVGQLVCLVVHPLLAGKAQQLALIGSSVRHLTPTGNLPIEWPPPAQVTPEVMIDVTSLFGS